jgi:type IV secretion system protein TrbD
MSEPLRRTSMFRALHRPNLLLGGERGLVLLTGILAAGIAITAINLPATIISVLLWFGLIGPLRMMAKSDPWLSRIYLRYLKYGRYYPARSRPTQQD